MNTTERRNLLIKAFAEDYFTPFKKNNVTKYLAEASSLMDPETGRDLHLEQIYPGSQDVGFAIQFGKAGPRIVYYLVKTKHNSDYSYGAESWEYRPTAESLRQYPLFKDTRAVVFND